MTMIRTVEHAQHTAHSRFPQQRPRRSATRWRALLLVIGVLLLQVLFASPAQAASGCTPTAERPGTGVSGTFDPPRPSHGTPGTWYGQYSYAGTTWHTYPDNPDSINLVCGEGQIDTWLGNQFFNVGKALVAGTNGIWYLIAYQDPLFGGIDDNLSQAAESMYDNAFTPYLSVVLLLAAVWILVKVLRGAMAEIAKKTMWIIAALWIAASSYLMPGAYTTVLDRILIDGARDIQTAMLTANGYEGLHGMPDMLYDKVVAETWLKGEFGQADSAAAKQYGAELLNAQAWTKFDTTENVPSTAVTDKRDKFEKIAKDLKETTDAYGYFSGKIGSRTGAGFLGMLKAFCFSFFPFLAELGQLLGVLLLRLLVLAAPVLGLAMILFNQFAPGLARGVGKALASCALLAVGSTVYLWIQAFVQTGIEDEFLRMLVMLVVTVIAMVTIRPVRQLFAMVGSITSAMGMPDAGRSIAGWRMFQHMMEARRMRRTLRNALGGGKRKDKDKDRWWRERPEGEDAPSTDRRETDFEEPLVTHTDGRYRHSNPPVPPPPNVEAKAYRMDYATPGVSGPRSGVGPGGGGAPRSDSGDEGPPGRGPDPGGSPDRGGAGGGTAADLPSPSPREFGSPRPVRELGPATGGEEQPVVPSVYEEEKRQRAEGGDPDVPKPMREARARTDEDGQTVYEVYSPSSDRVIDVFGGEVPPGRESRQENEDRGEQ